MKAFPQLVLALVTLAPPATLINHLADLKQIDRVASLPQPIRSGQFTVDGTSAAGWKLAEPHGAMPIATFAALRAFLEHPTSKGGWTDRWVKGDF